MSKDQDLERNAASKDWRIVLNLAGSVLLVIVFFVFMIAYPIYRKGKSERFKARVERAFGKLPALNRVADEAQAEFRTTYSGSEIEVGVSLGALKKPTQGEQKIDPKEFADGGRAVLLITNLTEEDLPRLDPILARALSRHRVESVKVTPLLDSPAQTLMVDGREITVGEDGDYVVYGETYSVSAAD